MSIISVKKVSKRFEFYKKAPGLFGALKNFFVRDVQYAHAVREASFEIAEGELVGFLGPNGAGKTTTLKMLSGILEPTGGSVRVLGFDPYAKNPKYQKQFALVMGQKSQLFSDLPAREGFEVIKSIYEIDDKKYKRNLNELVDVLGVERYLDIQVRKLSLGERMKLELIAALLHEPKVILLDEPTIGLDVVAQKNIRDFIRSYNQTKKTTVMLTSHYMEDIEALCKRVIIINFGSIVYDGPIDELVKKYAPHKLLRVTFDDPGVAREVLEKYGELETYDRYACAIRVSRADVKQVAINLLQSSLPVDDILIDEPAIDDVIRTMFSAK